MARLELPPRFFPFEFGHDRVLGITYDENTIERVELWPLVEGELPGVALPNRNAMPPAVPRSGSWAAR